MSKDDFLDLRSQAEEQLARSTNHIQRLERTELESLAHELAVHQVELEIQNEELRRTRLEAEEARDRYIDLFDFAPVGYFTLDEHNRVTEANLAGCQLLKIERKDICNKSFMRFIHPDESDEFYLWRRNVLASGSRPTGVLHMQTAEGTPFYAQIESLKISEERLRLVVFDISERKKLLEAMTHQKIQLAAANKELEAFTYSASHDLKAPLRAMDGFAAILQEDYSDKLDEKGQEYLRQIRNASRTMSQIINDMQKLTRIALFDMFTEKVNLSDTAQTIIKELQVIQPERRVEFLITPGIIVEGDRQLLQIGLKNLLENAWKFTGKNPSARIEFGVTPIQEQKVYFVKDNGAGFDMKYADKLFHPFQRLHSSHEFEGNGIGLAITERIVLRHGGRIWAEGQVGKGSTFYFTLKN
jgi:PAS domain S-box-containing protein